MSMSTLIDIGFDIIRLIIQLKLQAIFIIYIHNIKSIYIIL